MRPPTFTFEPYKAIHAQRKEARKRGFSINVKYGYITFPKAYVRDNNLDGKCIKWFLDRTKRALGWKILEKEHSLQALEDYKLVKPLPTGTYQLHIKELLNMFDFTDTNVCFKDLEVNKYLSKQEFFNDGTIHYLTLDDPHPCETRKKKTDNETPI